MKAHDLTGWRKEHGYTQTELGQKLGVTKTTVYRWEKGMREIPSFLHLALRCLELERGGQNTKGKAKKQMRREGKHERKHPKKR